MSSCVLRLLSVRNVRSMVEHFRIDRRSQLLPHRFEALERYSN